ncbi:hypothetical protein QQP08_026798 [Theobroma cacao]|nr:hypothetical protein QQP08_026798 [Theobroma cacao]
MGVLGLGLVVSALEETYGWDAIRVGSDIMAERRFCWWLVTGMLVAVSGWTGNQFEKLTDGEDSVKSGIWTVVKGWETVGLSWFYGVVVIWSFIVTAVFYCDCKKRLINKDINEAPSVAGLDRFWYGRGVPPTFEALDLGMHF